RAQDRLAAKREVRGIEKERPGLGSTDPAVERDQLLECAALVDLGVVEAADHDVRHVLEAVGAEQLRRRVRGGVRKRVLTVHAALGGAGRTLPAERDGTGALRADE